MMNWCGMNELTGRWKLNELWNYGEQLGRGLVFIHSTVAVSAVSHRSRTEWTTASLSRGKTAKGVTSLKNRGSDHRAPGPGIWETAS